MKKIYIILGLMLLKTAVSCNEPCNNISATFANNSGKDITAYSYVRSPDQSVLLFKETPIKNNSSFTRTEQSCPPEWQYFDFYRLLEGDSIVIDFGDRKKSFAGLNHFITQKPNVNTTYFLTPEDYANATPKP